MTDSHGNNKEASFETVTELPGNRAHREQIDALRTRYSWAAKFCRDRDVLEVACGAGLGLGLLAGRANSVIGGDLDPIVLRFAQEHYRGHTKINIMELDACNTVLADSSVDVVICFEAVYYFPNMSDFLSEIRRILRPDGLFLCNSVNCEWHGFNPSPYSKKYHSVAEMQQELQSAGFKAKFFLSFEDSPTTLSRRLISYIRSLAVQFRLIPKTMRAKELFKRLFYGKLQPLPIELTQSIGIPRPLVVLEPDIKIKNYKVYYLKAKIQE